ncbi:MAG TPA: hypothetical protein VLR94_09830, partial [Acidobacteriota bacterium]|nr:hypothetical protein [Acidobacteriota bacterium]
MVNRCSRICVLLVAASLAATGISAENFPQTSASNQIEVSREQLQAIEKEIQSLRDEASKLAVQENSLISTLDQYEVQVQMKSHEIELYGLRQQQAEKDIVMLQKQYEDQQKDLETQKSYLSRRLVDAYKLGRMNYLKLMLQASSASDLLRSYQYITFLAREDQRRLQAYRGSMKETESTRMRLEQESRNVAALKEDSQRAQAELIGNRNEKVRLLSAIQNQREMHLDALT